MFLIPWPILLIAEEKKKKIKAILGTVLLLMAHTVHLTVMGLPEAEDYSLRGKVYDMGWEGRRGGWQ